MPKVTVEINSAFNARVLSMFCAERAYQAHQNIVRMGENTKVQLWEQEAQEWLKLKDTFQRVNDELKQEGHR